MSLKSDLKEISIKSIFQMIFIEEKNGAICVESEGHVAMIFFRGGKIEFGKLDDKSDRNRLKLVILNNGYLTEKEWNKIADEKRSMDDLWHILSKRLDKSILTSLFYRQIEYTLFIMLQWKVGVCEYHMGANPPVNESLLSLYDGKHMLIEGFRAIDEWSELALRLPPQEAFLWCSNDVRKSPTNFNSNYILSLIKKKMQFKNLLSASKVSYCETGKAVELLLSARILKFSMEQEGSSKPEEELKNSTFWIYVTGAVTFSIFSIFYLFNDYEYYSKRIMEAAESVFNSKSEIGESKKAVSVSNETIAAVIEKNEAVKEEEIKAIENEVSQDEEKEDSYKSSDEAAHIDDKNLKKEPLPDHQIELKEERAVAASEISKEIEIKTDKADKNETLDELIKKAEMGEAEAQLELGIMYDSGRAGVKEDDVKAVKWYKKAAEEGAIPDAQFALGVMYNNGEGVKKNYAKAMEWYSKAAARGYGEAEYNLGIMYYKGEGVDQNKKIAAEWFYKSGLSFLASGNKEALLLAIEALKKIDSNHPALVKLSENP